MDSSIYFFIYFWLCWVSVAVHRPSLVSASRGYSHCGARASHCSGLVALQHVGSSWTRARTRVPCIGRRILNHCATREAPVFLNFLYIVGLLEVPPKMKKSYIPKFCIQFQGTYGPVQASPIMHGPQFKNLHCLHYFNHWENKK